MPIPMDREICQLFLSHGEDARRIVEQFKNDFGAVTGIVVLAPESLRGQEGTAEFQRMLPDGANVMFVSRKGYLLHDVVTGAEDVCVLNNATLEQIWAMARLSHDHCKAVILDWGDDGTGTWRSLFTAYPDAGQMMGM